MADLTRPCAGCGKDRGRGQKFCATCTDPSGARARAKKRASREFTRSCAVCGISFTASDSRRIYCTKSCSAYFHNRQPSTRPIYQHSCAACGSAYRSIYKNAKSCSYKCSRKIQLGEAKPKICAVCFCEFLGYERDTCSRGCYVWGKRHPGVPISTPCRRCYMLYVPAKRGQKFCSTLCSRSVVEQRRRGRKGSAPVEIIAPADIFERHGWICIVCDEPVDPALGDGHLRMASIDHVIPVASPDYPGHIASNLGLAHLQCNARKRHRSLAEIRRIIAAERLVAA